MLKKDNRHSILVNRHKLVYYRFGRGVPLLLVHGITTYSFIWRKLVPLLADKYELIIVDLLGCGESDKALDVEFSIKNHAKLLSQFISQLKIEKVHLVGHDVGGGICQIMAVEYPNQVISMTLINTVAYDFWPVQPIISMRIPIIRQLAMATLEIGALRYIVKRGLHDSSYLTKELLELFWFPMRSREGRKAFLYFSHCLDNNDLLELTDQIKQLQLPVLIIRGARDAFLSQLIAEKLNEDIRHSELEIIPDAGHYIQEEVPLIIAQRLHTFFIMTDGQS